MRKLIASFLAGLMISSNLYGATKADIDRARLKALGYSTTPVGTVVQSVLTLAQFQSINGSGWVKMTGQAITGSKLCNDFAICSLPDATDRYLRTADATESNLRDTQAQDTKLNGISISTGGASLTGTTTFVTSINNHSDINIAHGHGFTNPSVPAHYHSLGSGSAMSVSIDHDHESFNQSMATGTGGAHIHKVVKIQTNNPASSIGLNQTVATTGWGQSSSDYNLSGSVSTPDTGNTSSDTHSHSWTQSINIPNYDVDNRSVSGNVGNTSGSNGNGSFSTTGGGVTDLGETNKSISAHSTNTNTVGISYTAQALQNDGTETRPDSLVVNTFIKIN